ncbi:MAG: geranylgeranyl reductase family protein [Vicingaceae bacterium]
MEEKKQFDVIIVGAGPAGCAAAFMLAQQNLEVVILEKGQFPRDKICGDALSPDVMNQFLIMDEKLASDFDQLTTKKKAHSIHFFAPNHERLDVHYKNPKLDAFVAKRLDFDHFLAEQIRQKPNVSLLENKKVKKIVVTNQEAKVITEEDTFQAEIILGADGAHSVVKSQLLGNKVNKKHYSAGLRQYYKNLAPLAENSGIELHFYQEALPGYLWIFPLPNNQANVGIGMLSEAVSKHQVNLKDLMQELISTHPKLKERFQEAVPMEKPQGFGLPLGSQKVKCSGNRFLLLGDAASLIDPFTGEGIGNAIRSGRVAADHLAAAFKEKRFDAAFNQAYDKEIYRRMWSELRLSSFMQKMLRYPKLFNFIVKKANRNESLRTLITASLEEVDLRQQFKKPSFYLKLLFQ